MFSLAHLSDVHFGRIAYPEIVDRLVADVNERSVDLVVVSGDLTQRARPEQFQAAADMVAAFEAPALVVPGNHDVHAWWHRPVLRLVRPLRRYRRYFGDDLAPTFEREGVAVLGINSAFGWTIKGGYISARTRGRIASFFSGRPDAVFNVLVVHHHLTRLRALGRHDVARNARKTLETALDAGVDLVLCGHLHVSHIEPIEIVPGSSRRLVVASAGTATSNRGRGEQRAANFYNMVTITPDAFHVEERRYEPDARRFVREALATFERTGASGA